MKPAEVTSHEASGGKVVNDNKMALACKRVEWAEYYIVSYACR
jgi:hypothetical protein